MNQMEQINSLERHLQAEAKNGKQPKIIGEKTPSIQDVYGRNK